MNRIIVMSSDNKQSIISAIPQDASNIIKLFLLEKREVVELKLSSNDKQTYFIITNYKQGYKINKRYFDISHLEISLFTSLTEEEQESIIKEKQKKLDNDFPIYIDKKEDLIDYMYIHYILDLETYDDEDNSVDYIIELGGLKTRCTYKNFITTLSHYIKMLGKVYKKV